MWFKEPAWWFSRIILIAWIRLEDWSCKWWWFRKLELRGFNLKRRIKWEWNYWTSWKRKGHFVYSSRLTKWLSLKFWLGFESGIAFGRRIDSIINPDCRSIKWRLLNSKRWKISLFYQTTTQLFSSQSRDGWSQSKRNRMKDPRNQ